MAKMICNVIEMPIQCAWPVDETEGYPRDILPWADPYIAQLLRQQRRATGAVVIHGDHHGAERFALEDFDVAADGAGSDCNEEAAIDSPTAGDSPYEWDAFRFRGNGVL